MTLPRQLAAFVVAHGLATCAHYAALVALVQLAQWPPVPAALVGYVVGGVIAYLLDRRHVFPQSQRPHHEAGWRFAAVAALGFCVTWLSMHVLVDVQRLPYLLAQVATTGVTMVASFGLNRLWTFGDALRR